MRVRCLFDDYGSLAFSLGLRKRLTDAIDEPKGDPGNTLSREALADKFQRLTHFSGARSPAQADALIDKAWNLRNAASMAHWL